MSLTIFVIVRRDLLKELQWPVGAVISQACHAVSAVLWSYRDHPATIEYMADMDRMHKVTLEVKNEAQLRKLADTLKQFQIDFVEWKEQPENTSTAIATRPYRKTDAVVSINASNESQPAAAANNPQTVGGLFKKYQLFK